MKRYLLLWCSLLCWLFGCRLLGGGLFSSRLLGSLLCGGLFGSFLYWLLSLLCCGFLGLLGSGLLNLLYLRLLLLLCLLSDLEATSSLASGLSHLQFAICNSTLQSHTKMLGSLSSINLVVSTDVLQDSLTGGSGSVLEGRDGGSDHFRVLWVVGGCLCLLGSGLLRCSSSSRHY